MIFNEEEERIIAIGETNARGQYKKFGIKNKDRSRHMYVIGQTGTGKSTLLESMAVQDINYGGGFIFMDPHGQSIEELLDRIPPDRVNDVIFFAPEDTENPIGLNIMEDVGYDKRHLVVSSLISSFRRIWGESTWSDRMEHILANTLLALLEYPDSTLLDIGRMYASKEFRKKVLEKVKDPQIKNYWEVEYAGYTDRFAAEATPAIQNKLGQFVSNPLIRNVVGQPKSSFNFRDIMDQRKILLIKLSKGTIGDTNARLLGVLFSTKIYLSALSRSDLTKKQLSETPACTFYVDEFQSFASDSFADILSEARKYKLNLILAHQYVAQLSQQVIDAVFGNIPTIISFRVGPFDAKLLADAFTPIFTAEHLINLPRYHMYLTLNVEGAATRPFSAVSLTPEAKSAQSQRNNIINNTKTKYGKPREEVESLIRKNIEEYSAIAVKKTQKPRAFGNKSQEFAPRSFTPRNSTERYGNPRSFERKEKPRTYREDNGVSVKELLKNTKESFNPPKKEKVEVKKKEIEKIRQEKPPVAKEEGWVELENLKKQFKEVKVNEPQKDVKEEGGILSVEDLKKQFHKK